MHTEVLPDLANKSHTYGFFGKNRKFGIFVKYDLKISEIARSKKKIKCHNSTLECQANRGVETLSVVVV